MLHHITESGFTTKFSHSRAESSDNDICSDKEEILSIRGLNIASDFGERDNDTNGDRDEETVLGELGSY